MDRDKIKNYYAHDIEAHRLEMEIFQLEGIRSKEIIERYLQKDSIEILDVGGGAGHYSFWLHEKGNHVTLVDLSSRNIELVKKHSERTGIALKKVETGDAVDLHFPDNSFDIVLLLGPLYHLIDREERVKALSEARRVVKPSGVVLSAVISRYASLFDGFQRDLVFDDHFFKLLNDDLKTGVHLNATDNMEYFTSAYFHTPDEIKSEVRDSGLKFEKLIGIESFGWIVKNFKEKLNDAVYMNKLLKTIRVLEENEDLISMSLHMMAVGRK